MTKNKAKILVVEDNQTNRLLLVNILEDLYIVEESVNGADAIERTKVFHPDIILMDVDMPVMNGFDACEILQEDDVHKNIPIIFITAQDNSAYEATALSIGGADYITKPINANVTLSRIKIQLDLLRAKNERDKKIVELEKMVRIFELKLIDKPSRFSKTKNIVTEEKNEIAKLDDYVFDEHWSELEDIESEIDAIINRMFLHKTIKGELLSQLASLLEMYSKILRFYPIFNILGTGLNELSQLLQNINTQLGEEYLDTVLTYFESLSYTLKHWRVQIINKEIENPNMYDSSMLSDIEMISLTFEGKLDTVESDIEFF